MHRSNLKRTILSTVISAALLGCDEGQAPTSPAVGETREVTGRSAALQDITALGTIPLPVNQTFSGTALAFGITQTGTGPAGLFRINRSGSSAVALLGQTNGPGIAVRGLAGTNGRAGVFENASGAGTQDVLFARSNTNGTALHIIGNGLGITAKFEGIRNTGSNTIYVSALGSGNAVSAVNTGLGRAGTFINASSANENPALEVQTRGTGPAARFHTPVNNSYSSIEAITDGAGWAGTFNGSGNNSNGVMIHTFGSKGLWVARGQSIFDGDVAVHGTLTKSAGSFQIDHPLDPEHKYLSHSFVESPEMLNVYDGCATLDGRGEAVVMLPTYFEALNQNFRYQLTAVGAPGPNLYISHKIQNNRFVIAGGVPGAEVSWQVTGVRQDAYAEAHRIEVETDKPAAEAGVPLNR